MVEVEQKFRLADRAALEDRLRDRRAVRSAERLEIDTYLNAPDRDFAVTGEAFRLRQVGDENGLTFKGPKLVHAQVKVRDEHELAIASGPAGAVAAIALLAGLGYRPVAVVRKRRTAFSLRSGEFDVAVTIDDCETVGLFCEVEIVADESRSRFAATAVQSLAAELGLTDFESRSYLRMVLEAKAAS
jgi:adenylate cyclase class 2